MRMLGVIPARSGSKGIPGKNIKILAGKPLIAYSIESALKSKLDRVVVSTDSREIAEISKEYGAEVVIRPKGLAQDSVPTLPVIQDVVKNIEDKYQAIMTLQPTSPFRTTKHINKAVDIFSNDAVADSLVSVVKVPHNFNPEKLMSLNGKYLIGNSEVKRRQDMAPIYARNGAAIYITRTKNLDKYIFGGKILPYFMSKFDSIDIDDMEDWEIVEKIHNFSNK